MNWSTMSQKERDAAYDNTNHVANSAALNAARAASSAVFRAEHSAHLDLRYGPRERHLWDLFPAKDPAAPCVIFIHGGYWQRNNKEVMANLIEGPYAQGWSAALPGYTLAPDASLTQIAAEIISALDWLAANGPSHGISGPLILAGWSAGGHLTALCLGHPAIRAGLSISGLFELGPIKDTDLNDKLRLTDREVADLSPMRLPLVNKPLAIAYGTAELPALVDQSREFHARRSAGHMPGVLIPVPAADHFTVTHALRDAGGLLTRFLPMLLS